MAAPPVRAVNPVRLERMVNVLEQRAKAVEEP
jgi:hypothetical protein